MRTIIRLIIRALTWIAIFVAAVLLAFAAWAMVREMKDPTALAPTTGRYVEATDVRLFVQTLGKESDPPIILVHGMAAWSETWRPVMTMLADRGWYVIAVDMPPFGFSERPLDHDVWRVAQARRLTALMDSLNIQKATIVGHSYGSRAVLETAMRYPGRVNRLVLVDPALSGVYAPESPPSPIVSAILSVAPVRYAVVASTMTNPLLARTLLSMFLFDPADATDEILAVYRAPASIRLSTRDMGLWMQGFLGGSDTGLSTDPANYALLRMPVALLWGENDTTTPLEQGYTLNSLIPGSTLTVLPGLGHIPHIEDVQGFNAALETILPNAQ